MAAKEVQDADMEQLVYQLVMTGECTVPDALWGPDFDHQLFMFHEEVAYELCLKFLPLVHDQKKRLFSIHPDFLKKADPTQLESYRFLFKREYDEKYGPKIENKGRAPEQDFEIDFMDGFDDDDGDYFDEDEEDNRLMPQLDYRVENGAYATTCAQQLIGIDDHDNETDDYGLIENRQKKLLQALGDLCDEYSLPRLPVGIDESGQPCFKAAAWEVRQLRMLASARYREKARQLADLSDAIDQQVKQLVAKKDLSIYQQMAVGNDLWAERSVVIERALMARWQQQNNQSHFPSRINYYTHEVLRHFNDIADRLQIKDDHCAPREDSEGHIGAIRDMAQLPFYNPN